MSLLTIQAPAKLNLTLEVLDRRQDGFHEIRSVVQTTALCDSLHFQPGSDVEFDADKPDWTVEKSLVSRAVTLLQESTGCTSGAMIRVNKRIPLVSGLGGDSSDAAAVLSGLNELWGLGLSRAEQVQLARQLGSDVAFFLYGGTALVAGRGDIVTPLPPIPPMCVVLVIPAVPRMPEKTERLYDSLNAGHYTAGEITERLVASLSTGGEVAPSMLFNVFDEVALDSFVGLRQYWERFWQAGAESVHLAGSGPALFSIMGDKPQAEKIYRHLQGLGLESYLVETTSAKDSVAG